MSTLMQQISHGSRLWHLFSLARLEERLQRWRLRHALFSLKNHQRFRLDVMEMEDAYLVKAEMPGYSKDALKVEIDGNEVLIYAQAKSADDAHDGMVDVPPQYRYFTLQHALDDRAATAQYRHGVLELRLPKKQGSRSAHLVIQ